MQSRAAAALRIVLRRIQRGFDQGRSVFDQLRLDLRTAHSALHADFGVVRPCCSPFTNSRNATSRASARFEPPASPETTLPCGFHLPDRAESQCWRGFQDAAWIGPILTDRCVGLFLVEAKSPSVGRCRPRNQEPAMGRIDITMTPTRQRAPRRIGWCVREAPRIQAGSSRSRGCAAKHPDGYRDTVYRRSV